MVFTNGAHFVCSQLQSNACLLAARLMGCVILQGRAPRTDAQLSATPRWEVNPAGSLSASELEQIS